MAAEVLLFDYWRSSASYRVRIALNLLGIDYETRPVDLLAAAHKDPDYRALNPQGLVPTLVIDGRAFAQSLAIIEYLHSTTPGSPLLPPTPGAQARVRQLSYAIAMEIHPVCNSSVAAHAAGLTDRSDAGTRAWMDRFIGQGLAALEDLLAQEEAERFCHGDTPTMADCCLIPQLYNAVRWGVDYSGHARIRAVEKAARALPAFAAAHPDNARPPEDRADAE